jgi:hypothetical protein
MCIVLLVGRFETPVAGLLHVLGILVEVWLLVGVVRRVEVLTRPTKHLWLLLHHRLGSLLENAWVELVGEVGSINGRACLLNKIKVLRAAVDEIVFIHVVDKWLAIHLHRSIVAWVDLCLLLGHEGWVVNRSIR